MYWSFTKEQIENLIAENKITQNYRVHKINDKNYFTIILFTLHIQWPASKTNTHYKIGMSHTGIVRLVHNQ